jgi:hypothetical protein
VVLHAADDLGPDGALGPEVAGRQDATVGYAGPWRLLEHYPRATVAVLDRAGHALPHEQPGLLAALLAEWLDRVAEHATWITRWPPDGAGSTAGR